MLFVSIIMAGEFIAVNMQGNYLINKDRLRFQMVPGIGVSLS